MIIILGLSIGNSLSRHHTIKSNLMIPVSDFIFQYFTQYLIQARRKSSFLQAIKTLDLMK